MKNKYKTGNIEKFNVTKNTYCHIVTYIRFVMYIKIVSSCYYFKITCRNTQNKLVYKLNDLKNNSHKFSSSFHRVKQVENKQKQQAINQSEHQSEYN